MTGTECLKDKLLEMGCTKAQAESKVVGYVVSILANNPDLVSFFENQSEIRSLNNKVKLLSNTHDKLFVDVSNLESKKHELEQDLSAYEYNKRTEKKISEIQEYLDKFFETLNNGETVEGRDSLKKAQLFINSVNIDTKYDNTAFIVGLSAILSNGKCNVMEEMKKINPVFTKEPIDISSDFFKRNKGIKQI